MKRLPPKCGKRENIPQQILLVDGNSLFKQAYHGANNEYTTKSQHGDSIHVGGLVQFLRILGNYLKTNYFNKVYVFWDGKLSGKLRYEIYSDYKKSRNKDYVNGNTPDIELFFQQTQIKEYLSLLSIRQFQHEYIESDDLIAYYCNHKLSNEVITIMTNDRDMCQLIDDDVFIYLCDIKKRIIKETYLNFFNHHPDNSLLIKIICGDRSDDIKGVKAVGEKTLLKFFPELVEKKIKLSYIISEAKRLSDERKTKNQPQLKALENIITQKTDGIQGNKLYEINTKLMDLKNPLIDKTLSRDLKNILREDVEIIDGGIKMVLSNMKRDGIYHLIGDEKVVEFLLPYKKIIEREKK